MHPFGIQCTCWTVWYNIMQSEDTTAWFIHKMLLRIHMWYAILPWAHTDHFSYRSFHAYQILLLHYFQHRVRYIPGKERVVARSWRPPKRTDKRASTSPFWRTYTSSGYSPINVFTVYDFCIPGSGERGWIAYRAVHMRMLSSAHARALHIHGT